MAYRIQNQGPDGSKASWRGLRVGSENVQNIFVMVRASASRNLKAKLGLRQVCVKFDPQSSGNSVRRKLPERHLVARRGAAATGTTSPPPLLHCNNRVIALSFEKEQMLPE